MTICPEANLGFCGAGQSRVPWHRIVYVSMYVHMYVIELLVYVHEYVVSNICKREREIRSRVPPQCDYVI